MGDNLIFLALAYFIVSWIWGVMKTSPSKSLFSMLSELSVLKWYWVQIFVGGIQTYWGISFAVIFISTQIKGNKDDMVAWVSLATANGTISWRKGSLFKVINRPSHFIWTVFIGFTNCIVDLNTTTTIYQWNFTSRLDGINSLFIKIQFNSQEYNAFRACIQILCSRIRNKRPDVLTWTMNSFL